jgi:hypothetical protein
MLAAILRVTGAGLIGLVVAAATAWGSLALWFALPTPDWFRSALALGFGLLGTGCLLTALVRRQLVVPLAPISIAFVALLGWWSTVEPSNDRTWQGDVAALPAAEVRGDLVTLRNMRDFEYRSETDYTPGWTEKTVDLRQLDTLDLIAVYWMGDAIAHTILSFGFGGEQVAISIEIRKEEGEAFSALAGFFRRYELYYVVAEERDVIGLRTTHRDPPEDVYLYRVNMPRENIRRLFLEYAEKINELNVHPEFYNSATTNCTTNIVMHVQGFRGRVPLSWKMLLSGYFPELVYERGSLDRSLPFAALRGRSHVNERARAADGDAQFSQRIREGLPGIP